MNPPRIEFHRVPFLLAAVFFMGLSIERGMGAGAGFNLPPKLPAPAFSFTNTFDIEFERPVVVTTPPGESDRLFIAEQAGQIIVISDLVEPAHGVFLDITDRVLMNEGDASSDGEAGLLGLAFHPGFETNGHFFVYYTLMHPPSPGAAPTLHRRLSRFTASDPEQNSADEQSELPLITQHSGNAYHNGGDLKFGPDGYLYVTLGDGGGFQGRSRNPQRIDLDFFSGILRIDVDSLPSSLEPNSHPASSGSHGIPADNPFVDADEFNGVPLDPDSVLTEFFAVGLRNPWRITFDPLTGDLYVNDVGERQREEIDIVFPGGNYGWAAFEGTIRHPDFWKDEYTNAVFLPPLTEYGREHGMAATAGIVNRGDHYPGLDGAYVFADFGSGKVGTIRYAGSQLREGVQEAWSEIQDAQGEEIAAAWKEMAALLAYNPLPITWIANERGISTFGRHPVTGEILAANWRLGRIQTLVYSEDPDPVPPPDRLSEIGVFTDLEEMEPAAGLHAYELNVPFWSDHALKSRWVSLPPEAQMGFAPTGHWTFPDGTLWVKHFDLELEPGLPSSRRRLETRVLVTTPKLGYGLTYRWNDEQTDAFLVPEEGLEETFEINEGGIVREQTWRYPSRHECIQCHTPEGGFALGFNTPQLNLDQADGSGAGTNQLSVLANLGLITPAPGDVEVLPRMYAADRTEVDLTTRVRSYLAANCAQCHVPGGTGRGHWDAGYSISLASAGLINGQLIEDFGDENARVIRPGFPEQSVLFERVSALGPGHMPPLATSVVNEEAVALLSEWILEDLPASQTEASAEFLGETAEPAGSWRGMLGGDGYMVAGSAPALPDYVSLGMQGQQTYVWAGSTTETRALELPDGSGRRAATWYSWTGLRLELLLLDGRQQTVVLYLLDWENAGRRQRIQITDPDTGEVLDERTPSQFGEGKYLVWELSGQVRFDIRPMSGNAVVGGIFFDTDRHRPPDVALISPIDGADVILPDHIALEAAADPNAVKIDFLLNGTVVESVSEAPFEVFLPDIASGTHTLMARAFNALGLSETSIPVEFHARRLASAGLAARDDSAQGNWTGVHGGDGWIIPNYQTNLPDFVEFSMDGAEPFTWSDATDDERALLRSTESSRIASSWFSQDSFEMELDLPGDQFHRTALYFLDWDAAGRALLVEVFDADSGVLLERETVTDFAGGAYLILSLRGHVLIRITSIGEGNAVLSGIFLDSEVGAPPEITLNEPGPDTTVIAPGSVRLEAGVVDAGEVSRVEFFAGNTRIGTAGSPPFAVEWTNLLSGSHALRARAVNHSGLSEFSWPVTIQVQLPPPTVEFVGIDDTTRGDWWLTYGLDGSAIVGDELAYPDYARVQNIAGSELVWLAMTDDERALRYRNEPLGIASTWYSDANLSYSLELADGLPHQIGLYLLDWDGNERAQTVEVRDASNGQVLDSREMEQFGGGVHLVWNMSGDVVIEVQRTAGANAVVSGLFFDPVGSPYQSWRRGVFDVAGLRDSLVSGPGADPDEDGLPNVIEFLLVMEPLIYERLQGAVVDGRFEFEYARRQDAANFEVYMEASRDLEEWEPAGQYFDMAETDLDDVVRTVWRSKLAVLEDERIFLRMRVEVHE